MPFLKANLFRAGAGLCRYQLLYVTDDIVGADNDWTERRSSRWGRSALVKIKCPERGHSSIKQDALALYSYLLAKAIVAHYLDHMSHEAATLKKHCAC